MVETSSEFKKVRQSLGLSISKLGEILNTDPRTIRRWEAGDRPPNPIACKVLEWMVAGFNPEDFEG